MRKFQSLQRIEMFIELNMMNIETDRPFLHLQNLQKLCQTFESSNISVTFAPQKTTGKICGK